MSNEEKKVGRPRKEDPNADYTPVTIGVLTDTAFGLAKLPDGKNVIVRIAYNPLSGDVGTPEILQAPINPGDAEYDFRELVDRFLEAKD